MVMMGEEPAAPVRRICYTPPLPGLTPMPATSGVASGTWTYTYVMWLRGVRSQSHSVPGTTLRKIGTCMHCRCPN